MTGIGLRIVWALALLGSLFAAPAGAQNAACQQLEALVVALEQSIAGSRLGEARATASVLDATMCPELVARLASAKVGLAQAEQKARQQVALAILACDSKSMVAARQSLVAAGLELSPEHSFAIVALTQAIEKAQAGLDGAAARLAAGDASGADSALDDAGAALAGVIERSECTSIKTAISKHRAQAAAQRQKANEIDDVARSCNLSAIAARLKALRAGGTLSAAELDAVDRLTRLEAELKRAELARKLAARKQTAGDFAGAAGFVERADGILAKAPAPGACAEERARLASEAESLKSLAAVANSAHEALSSCDLAALRRAKAALLRNPHPHLDAERRQVETATGFALALKAAERSMEQGQYDRASEALDKLLAEAGRGDAPLCPAAIDGARQMQARLASGSQVLAALDAASQSCDPGQIEAALRTKLPDDPAARKKTGELTALVATLRQHASVIDTAKVALEAAEDTEAATAALAQFDNALPALPDYPACAPLAEAAASLRQEATNMIAAVSKTETALNAACKTEDVERIEPDLAGFSRYRAAGRLIEATRTLHGIKARIDPGLQKALDARDLDHAVNELEWALAEAAKVPPDMCAGEAKTTLRQMLTSMRDDVMAARSIIAAVPGLGQSCDMAEISASIRKLDEVVKSYTFPAGYFEGELRRLNDHIPVCEAREKNRRLTIESARCKARLGETGRVEEAGGTYTCYCAWPLRLSDAGTSCVKPRDLLEREANADCRSRLGSAGFAVDIASDGRHSCRCQSGYAVVEGRRGCVRPTGRDLEKVTGDWCRKTYGELSISVEVKSVDDYKCNCRSGTSWDASGKTCIRPSRKQLLEEARESCRKTYGNRLVKVTLNKDGTSICHYRKTREQIYRDALASCRSQHGSKARGVRLNKKGTKFWCTF
jgi:hypothetical protein